MLPYWEHRGLPAMRPRCRTPAIHRTKRRQISSDAIAEDVRAQPRRTWRLLADAEQTVCAGFAAVASPSSEQLSSVLPTTPEDTFQGRDEVSGFVTAETLTTPAQTSPTHSTNPVRHSIKRTVTTVTRKVVSEVTLEV